MTRRGGLAARDLADARQFPWVSVDELFRIDYCLGGDPAGPGVDLDQRDDLLALVRWLRETVPAAVSAQPASASDDARLAMEQALVTEALEESDNGNVDWFTLAWLAWGRRHDVPGWSPDWAPEGVEVAR